VTTLIIYALKI